MFEDTLIIWASEFGRTPMRQGIQGGTTARYFGRDHHPKGYTIWVAGGGLKPGMTYGATDEWGYWADEPVGYGAKAAFSERAVSIKTLDRCGGHV